MMSGVTAGFLIWRIERRQVAETRGVNCGGGGDNEINLGCVEFELFTGPQKESLPFIHLFISQIFTEHGWVPGVQWLIRQIKFLL